jgi:AcrR family transcriptional regulator
MGRIETNSGRNSAATRARIIAAAQVVFSERGYAQSTMREIAEAAGVAHSLILRYFVSKANLFAEALKASLAQSPMRAWPKEGFGARVASAIDDPQTRIISPGMVALAIGDDEARAAAAKILAEETMGTIAGWLGGPQAEARATQIMLLTMGYAIFSRHLNVQGSDQTRQATSDWMAQLLQGLVDGTGEEVAGRGDAPSAESNHTIAGAMQ